MDNILTEEEIKKILDAYHSLDMAAMAVGDNRPTLEELLSDVANEAVEKYCRSLSTPEGLREKKQYVVGFLFKDDKVALIHKNRPDWQKGKINGIGGHIEKGETPLEAMRREFSEEAGGLLDGWEYYCTMHYPEADIFMFRLFGDYEITTKTDEAVEWFNVNNLPDNVIPNLTWLIPLALYDDDYLHHVSFDKIALPLFSSQIEEAVRKRLAEWLKTHTEIFVRKDGLKHYQISVEDYEAPTSKE